MNKSGNTWTGSVTFGVGSDDPPPNNVEMVLPSSKREQAKGQRSQGWKLYNNVCTITASNNLERKRYGQQTCLQDLLVNVDSSSFSSSTVSKTDSTCGPTKNRKTEQRSLRPLMRRTVPETDPVQQKNSTFIHVEVSFDALWLGVCVLLKAAANPRQFDCGQVLRAKDAATEPARARTGKGLGLGPTLVMIGPQFIMLRGCYVYLPTLTPTHFIRCKCRKANR